MNKQQREDFIDSYNGNFIIMCVSLFILIIGIREWDIGNLAKWKGFVVILMGIGIYWLQIDCLIKRYEELKNARR
jgi:hypothetical protein